MTRNVTLSATSAVQHLAQKENSIATQKSFTTTSETLSVQSVMEPMEQGINIITLFDASECAIPSC